MVLIIRFYSYLIFDVVSSNFCEKRKKCAIDEEFPENYALQGVTTSYFALKFECHETGCGSRSWDSC